MTLLQMMEQAVMREQRGAMAQLMEQLLQQQQQQQQQQKLSTSPPSCAAIDSAIERLAEERSRLQLAVQEQVTVCRQ